MTASVLLLVVGLVTLLIGWNAGSDPVLYVSIGSTALAGILLAVSYLQERKLRVQAQGAGAAASFGESVATGPTWERHAEEGIEAETEEAISYTPADEMAEEPEEVEGIEELIPVAAVSRKRKSPARAAAKPTTARKRAAKAKTATKKVASAAKAKAKKTTAKPKTPAKKTAAAKKPTVKKAAAKPKPKSAKRK